MRTDESWQIKTKQYASSVEDNLTVLVVRNVSLQKNLQDVLIVTKVALVDMYTIHGENNTAVIYYVLQRMNGNKCVPTPILRYLAANGYEEVIKTVR